MTENNISNENTSVNGFLCSITCQYMRNLHPIPAKQIIEIPSVCLARCLIAVMRERRTDAEEFCGSAKPLSEMFHLPTY
jgi:hypothetical protein